eukprot:740028-Rhodomonas_salina.1
MQRVRSATLHYKSVMTADLWLEETGMGSVGVRNAIYHTEGRQYLHGQHVLAATDGSVKRSEDQMGAGFVFAETNDPHHHGAHHCSVGGDLSSLRAEAAALDLLLDHTDESAKL